MIKSRPYLTLAAAFVLLLCNSCSQIKLSKGGGSTNAAITNPANAPPPITGDWVVSFMYANNAFNSNITFSQQNKQLAGQGKDEATGKDFVVTGTVDGTKVSFVKKYADMDPSRQPVEYTGELEYENDADYRGWKMGGHYKTLLNGQPVDDKWVAVPAAAQESPAPPPDSGPPVDQGPPPSSSEHGPNISGQWSASYTYNFKKITSKLWLLQDGHSVSGHGVDTNTNEKFTIEKGWYHYPKVTLKCKYVKGKQAAATRGLTIKADVGGGPSLSGETNYGGPWQASIVR
jgi:hypothetical protein